MEHGRGLLPPDGGIRVKAAPADTVDNAQGRTAQHRFVLTVGKGNRLGRLLPDLSGFLPDGVQRGRQGAEFRPGNGRVVVRLERFRYQTGRRRSLYPLRGPVAGLCGVGAYRQNQQGGCQQTQNPSFHIHAASISYPYLDVEIDRESLGYPSTASIP